MMNHHYPTMAILEFYSIFIGRKKMGSTLKIFGSVEFSFGNNTQYLFKRTGNDGVDIEDSQEVLPLRDVPMRVDEYNRPELKVDLKDVGGKFQTRGFASRDLKLDKQICSVFPGEEGFCALHYSIFSSAFQAKIKIFVKNKSDDFGPDIVYGSAIAYYSNVDYPTEFEKNYFRSVLFKRTEKDSVRLKDNGRVPLSRCVVAVPMDLSLIVEVNFCGSHYHLSCTEAFKVGISSFQTTKNDHILDIKLTWSDGFHDGGNDSDEDKDGWSESDKDKCQGKTT
ncbi:unnamed protein product [Cuscuta campestris]|uniref:DUF6598 domain-containing protein n=1 Tax=Cuscuta campestris TaxID=132261 RepID=A0A484NHR6_9ASTE|nr:unnamed protein product [Cuscuta campestris]